MTSQAPVFTAVVIAVAVLAVGAWWMLPTGDPVGSDERVEVEGFRVQEPRPEAIRAKSPAPEPKLSVDDQAGHVRLPDGSFLPALNGVKSFAKLRWGAGTFSPIDHKIVDQNGIEWYILENGDQLTTVHAKGTLGDEEVWRDIIVHHRFVKPMPVLYEGEFVGEGSGSDKNAGTNEKLGTIKKN